MKISKTLLNVIVLMIICFVQPVKAQKVVVNEYFNAVDPRDEWMELIVVTDNTDMRNWTVRDNNSSQTAWQTAVTFNNISFWNNMRSGTIIVIWNRPITSGLVVHPIDVIKADGYIELDATNTTYFTGGSFGSSPTWGGNTLDYAGAGDIIELRDASASHIHALGHSTTAGANWTAMSTPKLNHANSASSGDAIYVCPGATITDYNGPATGNAFTSKNNTTLTFGLPNTCGASTTGNTTFIDGLREPLIASQSITPTISIPGNITYTWTAATDPNPSDNTIGYMILRNTSNTFTAPVDGTSYSVGGTLGSATIIAEINSSGTTTYTDSTVVAGSCYYYRIYAFRYTADDMTGTAFSASTSRGRAYNQTNFVFVDCLTVLPIELLNFTANYNGKNAVDLIWQTATETNNDFFTVERSKDGVQFQNVITLDGAGNSTQLNYYSTTDSSPLEATSYYRLKQTDYDGKQSYSNLVSVTIKENLVKNIYPNPANEKLFIEFRNDMNTAFDLKIVNSVGQTLYMENEILENNLSVNLNSFPKGIYILLISSKNYLQQIKFIKN